MCRAPAVFIGACVVCERLQVKRGFLHGTRGQHCRTAPFMFVFVHILQILYSSKVPGNMVLPSYKARCEQGLATPRDVAEVAPHDVDVVRQHGVVHDSGLPTEREEAFTVFIKYTTIDRGKGAELFDDHQILFEF